MVTSGGAYSPESNPYTEAGLFGGEYSPRS